jgi:hypothetical protein
MLRSTRRLLDPPEVVVEARAPDEWIVGAPRGERRLHVYRLASDDWLVSEVGRRNERCGSIWRERLRRSARVGAHKIGGA